MIALRLLILVLLFHFTAFTKSVKVGLFADQHSEQYSLQCTHGNYKVKTANASILSLNIDEEVLLTKIGNNVRVTSSGKILGVYSRISIAPLTNDAMCRVYPGEKKENPLACAGSVELKVVNNRLTPVNIVDIEEYTSAVVESEISNLEHKEMVNVQAILTRTFVLGNLNRHADDGYNVCDRVHCQVYSGRNRYNSEIHKIVRSSRDKVVVGPDNRMLLAAYHSNCGGQTAPSGDAWSENIPALQSVIDSFCLASSNSRWTKSISSKRWIDYLRSKGIVCEEESFPCVQLSEDTLHRSCCLLTSNQSIPAKTIRKDFNLKSAYFTISYGDSTIIFNGRGYGHGVGLCQQGAAAMAQSGFSADEILSKYYCGVRVVRYSDVLQKR